MTGEPVSGDELIQAREALVDEVVGNMPENIDVFLFPLNVVSPTGHCSTFPARPNCPPSNGASRISTSSRSRGVTSS
jgi:hypothetical protein